MVLLIAPGKAGTIEMQSIVIAEDPDERDILSFTLRKAGLAVNSSPELERVLHDWTDQSADLLLVACRPEEQPLEIVRRVRNVTQTSLMLIIDPVQEREFSQMLLSGADVLLERPVSPMILNAQTKALLRRSNQVPGYVLPTLEFSEIKLDPSIRTVVVGDLESKRLTQLEFRLLYVLMTHRDQVIPTEVLVERVWGYTGEGNRDLVRGLISRLRRKIEPDADHPHFIETVPGVGYRFSAGTL